MPKKVTRFELVPDEREAIANAIRQAIKERAPAAMGLLGESNEFTDDMLLLHARPIIEEYIAQAATDPIDKLLDDDGED